MKAHINIPNCFGERVSVIGSKKQALLKTEWVTGLSGRFH
jgi:hypothetical protein